MLCVGLSPEEEGFLVNLNASMTKQHNNISVVSVRNIDWNLLKIFTEISRASGVTQAARAMSRQQPTVSLALKRLEEQLGVRLCDRGPAGFKLTSAGERVFEICDEISRLVSDVSNTAHEADTQLRGTVRLGLASNLIDPILEETIRDFHQAHPATRIDVRVNTAEGIHQDIFQNQVDIGVAPIRYKHAELSYDFLSLEVYRAYCGCTHPLFGQKISQPEMLSDENFILTEADESDELTRYRLRYGYGASVTGSSRHLEEAKRLAILGIGICFLPERYAEEDIAAGRLWPLSDEGNQPSGRLHVISHARRAPHLAAARFLEDLRARLPQDH